MTTRPQALRDSRSFDLCVSSQVDVTHLEPLHEGPRDAADGLGWEVSLGEPVPAVIDHGCGDRTRIERRRGMPLVLDRMAAGPMAGGGAELVGRQETRSRIARALADSAGALVCGPTGVGVSALLADVARRQPALCARLDVSRRTARNPRLAVAIGPGGAGRRRTAHCRRPLALDQLIARRTARCPVFGRAHGRLRRGPACWSARSRLWWPHALLRGQDQTSEVGWRCDLKRPRAPQNLHQTRGASLVPPPDVTKGSVT